jgi:hypothetical protein
MTILVPGSISRVSRTSLRVSRRQASCLYSSLTIPLGAVVASSDNTFGEPSSFTDPLALPNSCTRDITYLKQLGVNTIRVYSVDSSLNHDSCMSTLSAAGIYTMLANLASK